VDVGFTNEGGVSTAPGIDAARVEASSTALESDAGPCIVVTTCSGSRMAQTIDPAADWCIEACIRSSPECTVQGVDLSTDHDNCGHCGLKCASFEKCVMSDCIR
jgi:hypothetical protein